MGIAIENVVPGMVLVLIRGPVKTVQYGGMFGSDTPCSPREDTTYNGMPLRCLAVSPPYIACQYHTVEGQSGKVTIDSRAVELSVASEAYLEAFCQAPKNQSKLLR